ncbi:MAG: DUF1926 domain-containing protein [Bacillota bacterium]|nr:DUF1926 domain-containing protein [Bacillota bacterium]HHU29448.1 DUF1926 domain-containing protein [Bacillota bacterium]
MAQNTIHFILALHNHQPEGNFDDVFRKTFQTAYEPFIGVLEDFPEIKVVQHYSGTLLRFLQENKPSFLARLRELTSSGRLELLGGAFYEPILVMIPDEDKIGQIKKMSRFLQENFHVQAKGAWLAERVWEPHLARPLAEAGISYTVLDDSHFRKAGFTEEQLLHYYLTEEEGRRLFIFPISEKLRYLIPFAEPEETVDYLAKMANEEGDRVIVLADDGEKFGSWPGTAKHVYEKKWLRRFFKLLSENSSWLKTVTFSEFLAGSAPAGRVYLPACSYREMMEWSGGFWRNYFARYPESNHLHKKMLYVREKVQQMADGPQKKEAREYLWAGQCNCAYWHGIFGGLYLNFLRSALYSRLIAAEDLADRALHKEDEWLEMKHFDFDYDGKKEIVVSSPGISFILAPEQGGALLELDFKPRRINLLDVLTRQKEAYHCDLFEQAEGLCADEEAQSIHHIKRVKEAGLEQLLSYDSYRRVSLLDHFFPRGKSLRNFNCEKHDTGGFVTAPYRLLQAKAEDSAVVVMAREGSIQLNGKKRLVLLKKTVSHQPKKNELACDYQLLSREKEAFDLLFAVEFNISFLAGHSPGRYYTAGGGGLRDRSLSSQGCLKGLGQFGMVDEWQGLSCNFRFDRPTTVWRMPLQSVSRSEEGMERNYQGSTLLFAWDVRLLPNTPWAVTFTQSITELVREGQK